VDLRPWARSVTGTSSPSARRASRRRDWLAYFTSARRTRATGELPRGRRGAWSRIPAVQVRASPFTSFPSGSAEASPRNELACTPGTTVKPFTPTSSVREVPRAFSQTPTSAAGSLEVPRPPARSAGAIPSTRPGDAARQGCAGLYMQDEQNIRRSRLSLDPLTCGYVTHPQLPRHAVKTSTLRRCCQYDSSLHRAPNRSRSDRTDQVATRKYGNHRSTESDVVI
jgi:hypothetical protein